MSLILQNISFTRNNSTIFDNFNYTFPDSSITPIVGPSGCGKTTLINIIAGLLTFNSGKVIIKTSTDENIIKQPSKNILVMNQTYTNFPWKTCLENTLFHFNFYGHQTLEDEKKASDILESVGLGKYINEYPGNLSGGMKQRLALSRVLFSDAPIIVMDEPLSALDETTRKNMQQLLIDYQKKTKNILIIITHDLHEAEILKYNNEILTLSRRA